MKNMLLVDDNAHTLEALALRVGVSLRNWNILTALDCAKGLEILNSVPVQFILTDVHAPVTDDYRIIDQRNRTCPHVPLFAVIDAATREQKRLLKVMRVSACIERPFDFDDLAAKILLAVHAGPEDSKAPPGERAPRVAGPMCEERRGEDDALCGSR